VDPAGATRSLKKCLFPGKKGDAGNKPGRSIRPETSGTFFLLSTEPALWRSAISPTELLQLSPDVLAYSAGNLSHGPADEFPNSDASEVRKGFQEAASEAFSSLKSK
jgi:hypothetical protein